MSMISDLVERLRAEAKSMGTYGTDYMATLLTRSADTIEMLSEKAREPKRGEWIDRSDGGRILNPWWENYECSKCGQYGTRIWNFCPNCGARMKGADDDSDNV